MIMLSKNNTVIRFLPAFTFIVIALFYLIFRSTVIGYGDALGFYITLENGFELNTSATSHFLYLNTLAAFARLPIGSLLDKAVIFTILFSLGTLWQIYRTVKMLTENVLASLAAIIALAFSFTYWRQTEIIEVYTFNNFIFASLLYFVIEDWKYKRAKNALITGLLFGLSLLAHIQNILLFPFFLFYLFYTSNGNYTKAILAFVTSLVIASILIIIPLLWKTNTLLSVFFQTDQFKDKALSIDFLIIVKGVLKSLGYFIYNFFFFIFFIIHGYWVLYRTDKRLFFLMSLAWIPFWAFACRYDVPDNYVFFLQAYVILTIVSGYSFMYWIEKYKVGVFIIPMQIVSLPLVYFFCWQLSTLVPQLEKFDKDKQYKGGLKYLLWPGMNNNGGDLLKQSKEIYLTGEKPESFPEFEWNYDTAIKYLKEKGELQ